MSGADGLALLAGVYLGLLSLMWLGLVAGIGRWGAGYALRRRELPEGVAVPTVTVCIPARDEAANIGRCVAAALASRWPDPARLEVLVVDDRSSDGTGALAREAGRGDPRLRVVEGVEPAPGWAGKPWACARAAREARGELLFFVDADVVLHPDALLSLAGALLERRLALLSVFGSWTLESFWEKAVIPAIGWFIRGAVNLDRVNDPARPEAFANGQAILVQRAPYEAIGGHGAVADKVLEDVRLAEAVKGAGQAIGLMVAPWAFQVRLYRSLAEIVAGYGKNLYEGMGRRPVVGLGAVVFVGLGTLLPALALPIGLLGRLGWGWPPTPWLAWVAGIIALQMIFRALVERRDGRSGAICWAHPLANAVLVWILLRSVLGVQARWKGRSFVAGRARSGGGS